LRTVALGLLLVLGLVGIVCGVGLVVLAWTAQRREPLGAAFGAFFFVVGSLALTAFAAPATRGWTIWTIAALFLARGAVFFVARRRA
jgi:hypothetical protein